MITGPCRVVCRVTPLCAIAGVCIVLSAAVQAQQPRSLYERYTEPIQIFKTGLGTFTRPMSSTNKEAQAFFDQGFQMMYAFAKPEAVRSFREAWKRDPELRDLLLGRSVGVGLVPERADDRRGVAARLRRGAEGAVAERARPRRRSARSSTRWPCATSRSSTPPSASSRIAPTPTRCRRWPTQYPDDLEIATLYADALFLLEPRRGTRDVNDPNVQRLHQVLESHPGARRPPSWRLSPLRARHRVDGRARPRRGVRRVPRATRFPAPATSTTCRRTRGTRSAAGATRCAPTSRPGIRIRRRRSARASRSIPSTTCTCCSTPRRTTARARSRCAPGRTTRS